MQAETLSPAPLDVLVVGGGVAGLAAAIYLSRYLLAVRVIDSGDSRASLIPRTHNLAGFPDGIEGTALLARMRQQAAHFGAPIEHGTVASRVQDGGWFQARTGAGPLRSRTVLLATGTRDRRPDFCRNIHDVAVLRGLVRYCPVCDGYEVKDRRVGVLGHGRGGVNEAVFLRSFTSSLVFMAPPGQPLDDPCQLRTLAEAGISYAGTCDGLRLEDGQLVASASSEHLLDSMYFALGSDPQSDLAQQLNAVTADGCIVVDDHQRTGVPGLYAAGDVVAGLNQISRAMGQAAVAATTIRNDLFAERPAARFRHQARHFSPGHMNG